MTFLFGSSEKFSSDSSEQLQLEINTVLYYIINQNIFLMKRLIKTLPTEKCIENY